VVLMAIEILKGATMPILECAWYKKSDATFSDVIALVRRHIWSTRYFVNSSKDPEFSYFHDDFLDVLLDQVCYAA
ncbi:MAG: hypothetical protein C4B58_14395, partial [Deltaproteobacteria bacterium]